jgi:adenylyl- and sulfurtransferase ThiI
MGGVPSTEILKGLKTLAGYVPKKTYWARLVDADDQTRKALNSVDDSVRGIFIARLMVRVALYLTRGVLGVVTADMFGHTGLESLSDLRLIDEVARLPVYRPLLMLDDGDASRQLEELGLRSLPAQEISAQAGVIRSQASIASLRELEERVNVEQLARALAASSTKIAV